MMSVSPLLALLLLLPFRRLEGGEETPIFAPGGTSGEAVGGGRGLGGEDEAGRLALAIPTLKVL